SPPLVHDTINDPTRTGTAEVDRAERGMQRDERRCSVHRERALRTTSTQFLQSINLGRPKQVSPHLPSIETRGLAERPRRLLLRRQSTRTRVFPTEDRATKD